MKNKLTTSHLILSFVFHSMVIFLFAFFYDTSVINKNFIVFGAHSSKPSHAIYRQGKPVPFIGGRPGRGSQGRKNTRYSKRSQKKSVAKKQVKQVGQKKQSKKVCAKKIASKVKDIEVIKESGKKKKASKKQKKIAQKEEQKEEVLNPKKQEEIEKEKELERELEKKIELEKKLEEEKNKQKKLDEKEEELEQELEQEPALLDEGKNPLEDGPEGAASGPEEWNDQDTLQFSLQSGSDPEMSKYQECIQQEVLRLWRPPVGVSKNTEIRAFFAINKAGYVEKFEIIKKSNVLIYDLSILRVAKKFLFDKSLWGKKFTIDFRQ